MFSVRGASEVQPLWRTAASGSSPSPPGVQRNAAARTLELVVLVELLFQLRWCVLVDIDLAITCHGSKVGAMFRLQFFHKLLVACDI